MELSQFLFQFFWNNENDSAFMLLLGLCVIFGLLCKHVENVERKKWTSTGLGILSIFLIGGLTHLWHVLMIGVICAFVTFYSGKRKCHIAAFVLMFSYLAVFRIIAMAYGTKKHETILGYMSLVQMMLTCKFVGVAFEIRNSFKEKQNIIDNRNDNSSDDGEDEVIDPSICDILHYGFSFFGMISGPYIRYRTFDDFLNLPYSKIVGVNQAFKKVAESLCISFVFLTIDAFWPLEYTLTSEFRNCSFCYKAFYNVVQFQRFFFWLTSGLRMAEAACAAAGLGAYPVRGVNKTSHGPTEGYAELRKMSFREAEKLECDFNTINSMDIKEVQTTPWMSVQTRSWNKSFQYFMGTYIFTSIPDIDALKNYRILITVFISAFWHGLESGYYIGMFTMPLYMFTERLYRTMYKTLTGWKANLLLFFMYAAKFYITSFGTVAFKMLNFDKILYYLISIKFSPYILHIGMHLVGLALVSSLNKNKKTD